MDEDFSFEWLNDSQCATSVNVYDCTATEDSL